MKKKKQTTKKKIVVKEFDGPDDGEITCENWEVYDERLKYLYKKIPSAYAEIVQEIVDIERDFVSYENE